jgi:hypothetical protein
LYEQAAVEEAQGAVEEAREAVEEARGAVEEARGAVGETAREALVEAGKAGSRLLGSSWFS